MESELLNQRVSLDRIAETKPFGVRFDFQDPVLEASLDRLGILCPLLAAGGRAENLVLISGHKRFFHAQQRHWESLPVSLVQESFSDREFFLLSLYSNWGQAFGDLDRMEALRKAENDYQFTEKEILAEVMPVLGLVPTRGVLEDYRRAGSLCPKIHLLIQDRHLAFQGASGLGRFSIEEQRLLAETVFDSLHLTSGQLTRVAEWLFDLKKGKGASLESVLSEKKLEESLVSTQSDLRSRGERFFAVLRSLRHPRLSEEEGRLRKLKAQIEENKNLQLHWPEGLEKKEISVTARLHRSGDLERVLRFLEAHGPALEFPLEG